MTEEERVVFAVRDLLRDEINNALDIFDKDNKVGRFKNKESIVIWDHNEGPRNFKNFIVLASEAPEPKQDGPSLFGELRIYVNIFYRFQKVNIPFVQSSRYRAAVGELFSTRWNDIIDQRKFKMTDMQDVSGVDNDNNDFIRSAVLLTTDINFTKRS